MRFVWVACGLVIFAACAPVREPEIRPDGNLGAVPVVTPPVLRESPPRAHQPVPARAGTVEISGIVFDGVGFDAGSHRLVVVDQAGGPGSVFADAAAAARSVRGIAAVNGGFFTPEGEPLGLVIAAGRRSGAWNSASSLGGGVWHDSGASGISRREKLGRTGASGHRELLQAGPMLVENGRAVSGLDALKTSARTVILWDGGSRWWIGRSTPASLARLAEALAGGGLPGWPVRHALNLDGGRSSDLWISAEVPGGPLTMRPAWNRPVRNFLVLVPRA